MKFQRCPSAGIVALSATLALFSSGVIASTSSVSSGCRPEYVADGFCDDSNNTEECGRLRCRWGNRSTEQQEYVTCTSTKLSKPSTEGLSHKLSMSEEIPTYRNISYCPAACCRYRGVPGVKACVSLVVAIRRKHGCTNFRARGRHSTMESHPFFLRLLT